MRATILLCLAAVLVASYDAAVVKAPGTRNYINIGYIGYGDRLLHRQYLYQPAQPNLIQYQDLVYRGNRSTRISAIQAYEVGYTQYANIWITTGGLGYNNVSMRVQSARGYGYYYQVDIWGQ